MISLDSNNESLKIVNWLTKDRVITPPALLYNIDRSATCRATVIPLLSNTRTWKFRAIVTLMVLKLDSNKNMSREWGLFTEISLSFHTTNRRQFGPNWHQNPWLFHVIYSRFILILCLRLTWNLYKFNLWNFHEICWKNDGISIGFGVIFEQTAVKRHEKIHVTFFTGMTISYNINIKLLTWVVVLEKLVAVPGLEKSGRV